MSASIRAFLEILRSTGRLVVVRREVDPKFELSAVLQAVQRGPNLPVLFERVRGTRYPVVSNMLGNYGIVAELLGVERRGVAAQWASLTSPSRTAVTAEYPEDDVDLEEIPLTALPHITYCEKDAGPYLTASAVVACDPDTGVANLSYHRMQMIGETELRCRLSRSGDLFRIQQKLERRGEPLRVAVLIGLPPAVMLAAGTTIPAERSEYDLAAQIAGHRFPLRRLGDGNLPVPYATEIIIEGEILPDVRRPEGPFGEWMDYYVPMMDNHVLEVRRVLARKDAFFYAIAAGSTEEIVMSAVPIAGSIYQAVRTWVPDLTDVACYPALQFCALQMRKRFEGQAQKAIVAAFGAEMNRTLYCVAVDDDVDIHDWRDVLWAMGTRCRPDRDTFQIPNVPSFARDPHQIHWGRLGIDATKPLEWSDEFERKKVPGADSIRLEDYL